MSEEINKNFKVLYDTSKTTFITDRTESTHFYEPEVKKPRIKNISYSINFDKKELYKQIDDLQQKVEQLEKENDDLKNRLDNEVAENTLRLKEAQQLENIRKEAIEYIKEDMYGEPNELYGLVDGEHLLNILNKGSDKDV